MTPLANALIDYVPEQDRMDAAEGAILRLLSEGDRGFRPSELIQTLSTNGEYTSLEISEALLRLIDRREVRLATGLRLHSRR